MNRGAPLSTVSGDLANAVCSDLTTLSPVHVDTFKAQSEFAWRLKITDDPRLARRHSTRHCLQAQSAQLPPGRVTLVSFGTCE